MSSVRYVPFDGEQVSAEWGAVLHEMRKHVSFRVNEGHRTMARQAYFYALYKAGGNLAAKPSSTAPHIRTGRIDHAIDFWNDGPAFSWLKAAGLAPKRTVRGESWHIEVSAAKLKAYASVDPVIRPRRKNGYDAVVRLQKLLRALNMRVPVDGYYALVTRRAVRRFQHKHGLRVDGVVGQGTWNALKAATDK